MKIDIYKSAKTGDKYLSVPVGTKVEDLEFPDSFDPDLLELSPFKTRIEIDLEKPRSAIDQNDVIKQIEASGYAVHGVKTTITVGQ